MNMIKITWEKTDTEYYYGQTGIGFSIQIGLSTQAGKFMWMIFKDDVKECIFGDSANTIEEAKQAAETWLQEHSK